MENGKFQYKQLKNFEIRSLIYMTPPFGIGKMKAVMGTKTPKSAYLVVGTNLVVHKRVDSIWTCPSPWVISDRLSGKNLSLSSELFCFSETRKKHTTRDQAVRHVIDRINEIGIGSALG